MPSRRLCVPAQTPVRPVLDRQAFEAHEVLVVGGCQHEPIHVRNRGDLTIDERRGSAQRFKPCSLFAVPRRRRLVVRQDRKRHPHDVTEKRVEGVAALALGKPAAAIGELVPDGRRNRALETVFNQTFKNRRVRPLGDRDRDDAGVEKICERQSDTLRPVVRSRVAPAKSSSTPISRSECFSRNLLYASPKC
jgi:hypothetical protein